MWDLNMKQYIFLQLCILYGVLLCDLVFVSPHQTYIISFIFIMNCGTNLYSFFVSRLTFIFGFHLLLTWIDLIQLDHLNPSYVY